MEQDLAASIAYSNKNNVWISDNMVTKCHHCRREFTLFVRKHHCRSCGNIFCYKCVNKYIVIPEFIMDRPDPADYWNISYYITSLKADKEKVCDQCYNLIQEKRKIYDKIASIFEYPKSIEDIRNLPDYDMDTKNYYFDHLRNIQYYLPNHRYSDIDKKMLIINAKYFSKHSKYIVHLIKSIDWNSPPNNKLSRSFVSNNDIMQTINEYLTLILDILKSEKIKSCNDLYCTRTCREQLSCDDCVNILFSCANILPDQLLKYLFDIIGKSPEQIILCHLTFFVSLVKKCTNKFLMILLHKLLNQSTKMIYHTYWFLNNLREGSDDVELENINNFIKLFDHEIVKKMHYEYLFFVGLIDNLDDPKKYLANTFDKLKIISLPYEPDIQLIGVDLENIVTKSSYTKPTIITFETSGSSEKISLLFKKESIMNDVIVLNLMTLCDIILNENLNTNFGVIVYPTMPLTCNSGMIEIVDKAETIYAITKSKKTLLQYIIEKNENQVIKDVLDRYMYSLVSYTLHSYFIGLGDRHLQNIMITDNGMIFHIDFGFILGTDSYPLTSPDIKLNSGMLDVIGNPKDDRYRSYLELCAKGAIILRKYFNIFYILLSQNTKFEEKHIEKFIMSRFQPRQKDDDVVSELMNIIQQSNNTIMGDIRDFFHYHTQEKTIQHGVSKVVKTAIGTIKNLATSSN